ncbi:hypothetical protein EDC01DRAFT_616288 [Geopyxis carbonaria]|nr:hypothetical protein EDC01DRAFT_616288 [Geopyxis carbonaria]
MKPIKGIVTNKNITLEKLKHLEHFTADILMELWKVYSITRDVVEHGRRLENLMWRVWGRERLEKRCSARLVSDIFMMICQEDDTTLFKLWKKAVEANIKVPDKRKHVPPLDSIATPRPSLEIECPPTPPPSPIPDSVQRGFATESYLSKLPPHTAITACLQQAFPPPPPSPPPLIVKPEPAPDEDEYEDEPVPRNQPSRNQRPPVSPAANARTTSDASISGAGSFQSQDSKSSKGSKNSGGVAPTTRSEQLRTSRGRRKKGAYVAPSRANRTRGIRPPPLTRKSTGSSTNTTTATSPTTSISPTTSAPQSLPGVPPRKPPKRQDSIVSEPDSKSAGWVVDPDFRTKYIEQKKQAGLVALRAPPTTAVASTRRRVNRRKNVLVVDELVPLKGLEEAEEPVQAVGEFITLPRQKSELSMLFESAGKGKAVKR